MRTLVRAVRVPWAHVKEVVRLAAPASTTMMSYSLVGLVDTLMVGRLGADALAAVGLAATLHYTSSAILTGLLGAATPLVAQWVGAGKLDEAGRILKLATRLAVVGGIVLGALFYWVAPLIIGVLNPGEAVAPLAIRWLQVRAFGFPFYFLIVARDHVLEGTGDTRTPFRVSLVVNGLNMVLNWLFVWAPFGLPGLGVSGSALATNVAQGFSSVLYGWVMRQKLRDFPALAAGMQERPSLSALRSFIRTGWPMSVQYVLDNGSWMVMTVMMTWLGAFAQAANQVSIRLLSLTFLVVHGLSIATTTLVGQSLGGGRPRDARKYVRAAMWVGAALVTVNTVLYLAMPRVLCGGFTKDPQVLELAVTLLVPGTLVVILDMVVMVASGALKGAGDTRFPMLAAVFTAWGVGVPLTWLLTQTLGQGPMGVYYGLMGQIGGNALLLIWRLLQGDWVHRPLLSEAPSSSSSLTPQATAA